MYYKNYLNQNATNGLFKEIFYFLLLLYNGIKFARTHTDTRVDFIFNIYKFI